MTTNGTAALATTTAPVTKAIERVENRGTQAFEPNSLEEAYRLSKVLVASGMLPKHVSTPEAAFAIIASGRELGLTAMQSLRSIYFFEGKVTLSADLACGLVKKSPLCDYFRLVESTDKIATYETKRRDEEHVTKLSFTWAQAEKAKLTTKAVWQTYADAMLRARCIMALARAVYPDVLLAVYDPEELERAPKAAPAAPASAPAVNHTPDGEIIEEPVKTAFSRPVTG